MTEPLAQDDPPPGGGGRSTRTEASLRRRSYQRSRARARRRDRESSPAPTGEVGVDEGDTVTEVPVSPQPEGFDPAADGMTGDGPTPARAAAGPVVAPVVDAGGDEPVDGSAWSDDAFEPAEERGPDVVPVVQPAAPVDRAEPAGEGRRDRYVRARRVRRTIRRVDPISVGKLALVFNVCFFIMVLVAGVILWSVAQAAGSIGNIESFIEDIGFEDFELDGGQLLRGFAIGGGVLVVAGSLFAVLLSILFNLVSDVVGGVRITMVEPDVED